MDEFMAVLVLGSTLLMGLVIIAFLITAVTTFLNWATGHDENEDITIAFVITGLMMVGAALAYGSKPFLAFF